MGRIQGKSGEDPREEKIGANPRKEWERSKGRAGRNQGVSGTDPREEWDESKGGEELRNLVVFVLFSIQ